MIDSSDKNIHINRILSAFQPMEEMGGPDEMQYIAILEYIKAEIEERIENCKGHMSDPMGDGDIPDEWP